MTADRIDSLPSAAAEVLAERNLVRRIMTWTAIVVPAAAAFFALLVYAQIGFSDSHVVVRRSIPLALAGIPERHFGDSRPNGIISAYPASS